MYEVLCVLLINKSDVLEIIGKTKKIEETNLIIDSSKLTSKAFFLYNQYLKVTDFKKLFTDDALILLENCINHFKSSQTCFLCTKEFGLKDNIKICCDCFKIYHYKCTELKLISTKIWKCKTC